jgi:hypothetical protein
MATPPGRLIGGGHGNSGADGVQGVPGVPDQPAKCLVRILPAQQRGRDVGHRGLPHLPAAALGQQGGVLDCHRGRCGQRPGQFLVIRGEPGGVLLLGQIQISEYPLRDVDRHTEEGPHRRVVLGESDGGDVLGDLT